MKRIEQRAKKRNIWLIFKLIEWMEMTECNKTYLLYFQFKRLYAIPDRLGRKAESKLRSFPGARS